MIRSSVVESPVILLKESDKKQCKCIAWFVLAQCFCLYAVSLTILQCVWKPHLMDLDPYRLASIMYLYDTKECGLPSKVKTLNILKLNNDTKGLNVYPIRWEPAILTVATRLSHKTRLYIEVSIAIHTIWMLLTFVFKIIIEKNNNMRLIRIALKVYLYTFIAIIIFDLSMGIVYISHIKQALTKGMIVRYSGWSVELQFTNMDDYAGYLPMIASACWMRGLIILAMNFYSCKRINTIQYKVKTREIFMRLVPKHKPFPEVINENQQKLKTLYLL